MLKASMSGFDADSPNFGDEILGSMVEHLSRSRLFKGVPRVTVQRCAPAFNIHPVPARTVLVLDGNTERRIHVIRNGRVRLEIQAPPSSPLVIAKLGRSDAFGVEALVGSAPQPRHASFLQPATLYSAPAAVLKTELHSCAKLWANVAGILGDQLNGAAVGVSGLAHAGLCERVLATLERVAAEHGVSVADGTLLDVGLAAVDVAVVARTSQADAAAALFYLERADRIRRNGTSITLLRAG